jgi:nicotinamide mononucleotide (NMN) deamidase PncC
VRREVFSGDREMVRRRAAQAAMDLLFRLLAEAKA